MSRPILVGMRLCATVVALVAGVVATGASAAPTGAAPTGAAPPSAQALPTPRAFVSHLDLECFATAPYTPPLTTAIVARHLNPVLSGLPTESHVLGARTQLCVPVAKNGVLPPPGVIDFVRYVDLSCYRITGQTVNFPLGLRHLNPQLQTLPGKNTIMLTPEQLCLPVVKNNAVLPAEVLNLVRYIDLKCYKLSNPAPLGINIRLTQLNPVLAHLPTVTAGVRESRQLCVPVHKNNQPLPIETFNIIRWIDLEKYDIVAPALITPVNLTIRHINPLLVNLPPENVSISVRQQLALPVSKNGMIPPG